MDVNFTSIFVCTALLVDSMLVAAVLLPAVTAVALDDFDCLLFLPFVFFPMAITDNCLSKSAQKERKVSFRLPE